MELLPNSRSNPATNKVRAYFDLVRFPNLFTAAADVLAGFFFAGGKPDEWLILIGLAAASVCLYAGGVVLNDVCDAEQDAGERPHRPIPSGVIARPNALRFAGLLLGAGIFLAAAVSGQALLVSVAIVVCIISYNLFKQTPLAPPLMGLCRAFNLLLGMYGLDGLLPLPAIRPMGVMGLYVASLTFFARKEARGGSRLRLMMGTLGMASAVVGLWGFRWYGYNARYDEYRFFAALMLAGVLYLGAAATLHPSPARIQRAVRYYIPGIILLDACIAWVSAGPIAAFSVGALMVPFFLFARFLRVT